MPLWMLGTTLLISPSFKGWWWDKGSSYLHNSHGVTKRVRSKFNLHIKNIDHQCWQLDKCSLMTLQKISSCSRKCPFQLIEIHSKTERLRPLHNFAIKLENNGPKDPNWLKLSICWRPFSECIWYANLKLTSNISFPDNFINKKSKFKYLVA